MQGNKSKTRQGIPLYSLTFGLLSILILAIIALVSSWLLPPIRSAKRLALNSRAKTEMASLVAAITSYQTAYGLFPLPSNLPTNSTSDFTFGTFGTSAAAIGITNPAGYQANNSDLMAILLDLTKFPNGKETVNADHSRNPRRTPFLNVRMSEDTNSPGVGLDGVYRDPWGNPYIITLDLNNDTKSRDAFYRLASVSEIDPSSTSGLNRLFRFTPPPYNSPETRDAFEAQATIMVWSLGPDGTADAHLKADKGVNKDNILSW